MKQKKQFLLVFFLWGCTFIVLQAQNYLIDFTASGTATTLDSVYVENLTQSTSRILQGNDTLHLFGTVGITTHNHNSGELKIYPNPFNETSKIEFYSETPTIVSINIYDVVGKHIIHLKQDIQKGTNLFEISGFSTGHYKLSISTDTWQKSAGFVSLHTGKQKPQIQHRNSISNEMQPKSTTKNTKSIVPMSYNTGDQLRFIGYSGLLSKIVNDVPTSSKTIDFVFATFSCGDTVTFTYNGSSVTYGTVMSSGQCWLDRNLGAFQVATSSTDAAAYGDLFQWGRAADGHQIRTSGTTSTLSGSDTSGHGNFILAPNSPYDWRSPQNANLWQGVSGTNNPCPSGWRVPIEAEWNIERLSWSSNNAAGAFASPLKLPMAGSRISSNGSLSNVGYYGYYWSNTVGSTNSSSLRFSSSSAGTITCGRANGFSVRCIKD